MPRTFLVAVGARPNLMKAAPVLRALGTRPDIRVRLVHTGQHYDDAMAGVFFEELALPKPDVDLGIGSGSHAEQTARVMLALEPLLRGERPDVVIVVGDVNSTLACGLTAAKLQIPVAHVEAGLRSDDRTMPEEINRLLTDHVAEYLFAPSEDAVARLRAEGISASRIFLVGNVMIDTLLQYVEAARARRRWAQYGLAPTGYALLTLHRPSNVDEAGTFASLLEIIHAIQQQLPVVFPVHPRTEARLEAFGLKPKLSSCRQVVTTPPLGYLDFISLLASAKLVLTDSGGVQEEATVLGVPCLTLRDQTERPITVEHGTNLLVSRDRQQVLDACGAILSGRAKVHSPPPLWDGHAAERIVEVLVNGRGSGRAR